MSDPDNFLARWSRKKREAAAVPTPPAVPAVPVESARAAEDEGKPTAPDTPEPAFDLTRLPSIESITAATDIRAFLAPGVPPELTRAALRRVWTADPAIRDFVGLADYDWDFNTPGAIPGFGPLEMTDELRRLVTQMVGRSLEPEPGASPKPTAASAPSLPPAIETSTELAATNNAPPTNEDPGDVGTSQEEPVNNNDESRSRNEMTRRDKVYVAAQYSPEKAEDQHLIVRRPRGRALPE